LSEFVKSYRGEHENSKTGKMEPVTAKDWCTRKVPPPCLLAKCQSFLIEYTRHDWRVQVTSLCFKRESRLKLYRRACFEHVLGQGMQLVELNDTEDRRSMLRLHFESIGASATAGDVARFLAAPGGSCRLSSVLETSGVMKALQGAVDRTGPSTIALVQLDPYTVHMHDTALLHDLCADNGKYAGGLADLVSHGITYLRRRRHDVKLVVELRPYELDKTNHERRGNVWRLGSGIEHRGCSSVIRITAVVQGIAPPPPAPGQCYGRCCCDTGLKLRSGGGTSFACYSPSCRKRTAGAYLPPPKGSYGFVQAGTDFTAAVQHVSKIDLTCAIPESSQCSCWVVFHSPEFIVTSSLPAGGKTRIAREKALIRSVVQKRTTVVVAYSKHTNDAKFNAQVRLDLIHALKTGAAPNGTKAEIWYGGKRLRGSASYTAADNNLEDTYWNDHTPPTWETPVPILLPSQGGVVTMSCVHDGAGKQYNGHTNFYAVQQACIRAGLKQYHEVRWQAAHGKYIYDGAGGIGRQTCWALARTNDAMLPGSRPLAHHVAARYAKSHAETRAVAPDWHQFTDWLVMYYPHDGMDAGLVASAGGYKGSNLDYFLRCRPADSLSSGSIDVRRAFCICDPCAEYRFADCNMERKWDEKYCIRCRTTGLGSCVCEKRQRYNIAAVRFAGPVRQVVIPGLRKKVELRSDSRVQTVAEFAGMLRIGQFIAMRIAEGEPVEHGEHFWVARVESKPEQVQLARLCNGTEFQRGSTIFKLRWLLQRPVPTAGGDVLYHFNLEPPTTATVDMVIRGAAGAIRRIYACDAGGEKSWRLPAGAKDEIETKCAI